jgi:hypothetical protein
MEAVSVSNLRVCHTRCNGDRRTRFVLRHDVQLSCGITLVFFPFFSFFFRVCDVLLIGVQQQKGKRRMILLCFCSCVERVVDLNRVFVQSVDFELE